MKYRTLNPFLIVLLSSLLVLTIVDANNHKHKAAKINSHNDEHKICTFTQTSSQTVTIYETPAYKAYETPSYKSRGSRHYNNDHRDKYNSEAYRNHETRDNRISRHYKNDRKDKHNSDCKETITVTFTPTTTLCSTPTPTCCQSSGGPGWQNEFHTVNPANVFIINNITSPQDCCKHCLDDPECIQWALPGECVIHKNLPSLTDICTDSTVNNTSFGSGIIRCNDSGNCI
ncbi:hypothetical protein F8M41_009454 [Gigaspora margarita]|uniref:Apple domain-containing protein n=1 Tax=Gigaspora margarita TaxID=4874 RepID=A0A8H4AV20_GIGMA|nr:hypothetical protein F8M41_009454 [Gigaspora margarita]